MPDLATAATGDEFHYASVPLCVLDAVFSINTRYQGVQNLVGRYCARFRVARTRPRPEFPPRKDQLTVSDFVAQVEDVGIHRFTAEILQNRGRTSTRSGILKSEASLLFANALRVHGVETLQDVGAHIYDASLDADLRAVPGQGSGLSIKYFFMLAGSTDIIKPDRMILRFLTRTLERNVSPGEAQELLVGACEQLKKDYPAATPQGLDHLIWSRERSRPSVGDGGDSDKHRGGTVSRPLPAGATDPQSSAWLGYPWSPWIPFVADTPFPGASADGLDGAGLYRFRVRDDSGLLYIGEAGTFGLRGRINGHRRTARIARSPVRGRARPYTTFHLRLGELWEAKRRVEVSWTPLAPDLPVPERKGREVDLIAAHRKQLGRNPECQFLEGTRFR